MKKSMANIIAVFLFLLLSVISINNAFADGASATSVVKTADRQNTSAGQQQSNQSQVASEKTISGLIIKKETCLENRTSLSCCPCGPATDGSTIKSDVNAYILSLQDISDRYKIILKPTFAIGVGDNKILPDQLLPDRDFIKITYSDNNDKASITSVTVEKIKPAKKVKWNSIFIGLGAIAILVLMVDGFLKKIVKVYGGLFVGQDNRYSNSKFQMVFWTFLVIFSYITLFSERLLSNSDAISFSSLINIPESLGILMGISAGSFLGAKTITFSKVQSGSIAKTRGEKNIVDLVTDDNRVIDWGDTQMFAWTLVAIGVYIVNFYKMLGYLDPSPEVSLPDVDSTLLVLTGVSQAAYIGKKLVASDVKPTITSIDPNTGAKVGDKIVINGTSFGNTPGKVLSDSKTSLTILSWYDSAILAQISPGTASGKTLISVQTSSNQVITSSYDIA
jgi:IPT/TIG domain